MFSVIGLVTVLLAAAPPAGGPRTIAAASEAYDRKITGELRALDPDAAALFERAGTTRKTEDHAAAAALYRQVLERVPTFVHALRRLAYEEIALGQRAAGLERLRSAVAADHSAVNLAALATALTDRGAGEPPPTPQQIDEAYHLASEASALDPLDAFAQIPLCSIAMTKGDIPVLGRCVANLKTSVPDDLATHFFDAVHAASENRIADARQALERARALGLPEEGYESFSAALDQSDSSFPVRPEIRSLVTAGGIVGVAWVAVLALLLASGWLLSAAALRASNRIPADQDGRARGGDAALRRVYRVVLWLCCLVYYVSLPLLIVLVLAVGGGLLYLLLSMGRIPLKLLAIIAIVTLATLWAILKSLLVRRDRGDPGLPLDLAGEPKLRALLDEVAGRVETRPVDAVYLTPGADVAVMERGGMLRQLGGSRERCLILGIGVLEGMRQGPFKAVLAHEYGHFSNRDTAGGSLALAVRRSLITMAQGLARGGAAAWYNPAWLFVNGFYRIFLRISQGASRLQEMLADRWAATLYGAQAFEAGLTHVIARSVRFDAHIDVLLKEVVASKSALANLYESQPVERPSERALDEAVKSALAAQPSPYDSHPSPSDRFAWVRRIPWASKAGADDDRPCWDLFEDREWLERKLTEVVRENVALLYGVSIPAEPAAG